MSAYGLNRAKGTQAPVKSDGAKGSNSTVKATGGQGNTPARRYSNSRNTNHEPK